MTKKAVTWLRNDTRETIYHTEYLYLEFRKPLDGFKRSKNSEDSEGLYCLDVSAFVVSVDGDMLYLGMQLYTQTNTRGKMAQTLSKQ